MIVKKISAALAIILQLVEAQAAEVLTISVVGWVTATFLLSKLRAAGVYTNRGMCEEQTATGPDCLAETWSCDQQSGWTGLRLSLQ